MAIISKAMPKSKFISYVFVFILTLTTACAKDFYSYEVEDTSGKLMSLEKYRGKVS